MVLDLAVAIALGGDCLADVAVVRAQPELFGAVASDPDDQPADRRLGDDPGRRSPRSVRLGPPRGPRSGATARRSRATGQVVVDLDATLVGAHSEKEGATPNFKRSFGFHPMLAFVDHGAGGTGEPLAAMLRPGRANANDAADQIAVLDAALAQLPEQVRARVLVRGDTGRACRRSSGTSPTWGWSTRSGSTAANPSWTRWLRCPNRPGAAHSTPTATHARAPRSPS